MAGSFTGIVASSKAGGGGSFPPTNMTLWLKADALSLSDGAAVTSWADSSGAGHNYISNGDIDPVYSSTGGPNSKPCVTFDTSQECRLSIATGSYIPTGQISVFAVLAWVDTGATYAPFGTFNNANPSAGFNIANTGTSLVFSTGPGGGAWYNGASQPSLQTIVNNTFYLAEMIIDATSTNEYLKGVNKLNDVSHGAIGTASQSLQIGCSNSLVGSADFWPGKLCELIITSDAKNSTDRVAIENALIAKYAL